MSEESAAPDGVGTSVLPGGSAAAQRARAASSDQAPTIAFRGSSDASVAVPAVEDARLLPGTVIDRYIIVDHLGSGGLGDVYKAYDPELDRRIAIKLLRASVVQREAALGLPGDRLRREAQALAKLHHPNVVSVHDVGDYGGQLFIAMGFAEGLPLNRWAQANRPGWSRVRDVFLDAGRGLAAAHQAGLVHRDFKPANVVVGSDDSVVVLDFGLARAANVDLEDEPTSPIAMGGDSSLLHREVTGGEVLLGTPAYMAPELFRSGTATQASDQFAFCVALFESLYGHRPFVGEDKDTISQSISKGQIEAPRNDRRVPDWVRRAVLRGLSHDPADRWPSMKQLVDTLDSPEAAEVGRGTRVGIAAAIGVLFVALPLAAKAVGPPLDRSTYAGVIGQTLALLAMLLGMAWISRNLVMATPLNRKAFAAVVSVLGMQLPLELANAALGVDVVASDIQHLLLWAAMAAMFAVTVDRRFGGLALVYLLGLPIATKWPEHHLSVLGATNAAFVAFVVLVWRGAPRQTQKPPPP